MIADSISDSEKLDLFLRSSVSAGPLEVSRKVNHVVASSKEVESIATRQLDAILSKGSHTQEIHTRSELAFTCFACLYTLDKQAERRSVLAKRHQLYVVRLLETKQFIQCFEHLGLVLRAFGRKKFSTSVKVTAVNDLLEAVDVDYSIEGASGIAITYFFVTLQAILQHISVNAKVVVAGYDSFIQIEDIQLIVQCFHSSSTFSKLLDSVTDESQSARYIKNSVKLLRGYHKVFNALSGLCQLSEIAIARDCILLKLLQYDSTIEKEQLESYVSRLSYDGRLMLYVEDLATNSNFDISLIQVHFRKNSSLGNINLAMDRFMVDPSPVELENIKYALFSCKEILLNNEPFLRKLSKYSIPQSITGLEFARAISESMLQGPFRDENVSLSSTNLRAVDSLLSFLKNCMSSSATSPVSQMVDIIQSIHKLLRQGKSISRSRMLSNMIYNLGNRSRNPDHWSLSIQYECAIYKIAPTTENLAFYESKAMKVSNVLLGMGFVGTSLCILKDYLISSQVRPDNTVKSQVVHLLVKILREDINLVLDTFSKLREVPEIFTLRLMLQIFQYSERILDPISKTKICNSLVRNINFKDPSFQAQFQLGYYNTNGITDIIDLPVLLPLSSPILNCDLYLQKLVNFGWNDTLYEKCQACFFRWADETRIIGTAEAGVVESYILFLELNALHGQMITSITKILPWCKEEPRVNFFLNYKLAVAMSQLGYHDEMYKQIKQLMTIIKENRIVSIPSILSFKLLQLDYAISMENREMAINQFNKILKFVKSKPELDISESTKLSLQEKFQALLLLARFQVLGARLNILLQKYVDAYKNCKVSLKILNSIMVKLGSNFPKAKHVHFKLSATILSLTSFVIMIQNLNFMGVPRDMKYYVKGLRDMCASLNSPARKAFVLYDLIGFTLLLGNSEEVLLLNKDLAEQWEFNIVRKCIHLARIKEAVDVLLGNNNGTISKFGWRRLHEIDQSELSNLTAMRENFLFDFHNLQRLINPTNCFFNTMDTLKKGQTDLINQVSIIKEKILHYKCSILKSGTYLCPGVILSVEGPFDSNLTRILDKLVSYKEFLLQISKNKALHNFHDFENQEIYKLLHLCLSLLSQITSFRQGSTVLYDLLLVQDSYLKKPFENELNLNQFSALGYKELTPDEIAINTLASQPKLELHVSCNLPSNWKVVGIDICELTGDLLLTESTKGSKPRFLRLDVGRFHLRNKSVPATSISELYEKFQLIIQESNLTTKAATTSKIITRDDRIKWWNHRFDLDLKVKESLDHLENFVLGGFKSVFGQLGVEETFQKSMHNILDNCVKSSKSITFGDEIINLFCQLKDFDVRDIEDLLQVVEDAVMACDKEARLDHEFFINSVEDLFRYAKREDVQSGHIVLIPNGVCNHFPWESLNFLKGKSVSRAPSYTWLNRMLDGEVLRCLDKSPKTLYLINPGGDLQKTENRLRPIILTKKSQWCGYVGQIPNEIELVEKLIKCDLFLYLGHGCCQEYIKPGTMFEYSLLNGCGIPPALLIGCSSAALKPNGFLRPSGSIQNWLLCKSPMIIGNLWDVTDKDIDMFSLSVMARAGMIEQTPTSLNFAQAVDKSRDCCTLKYLNGSAPIMYGLPLVIR